MLWQGLARRRGSAQRWAVLGLVLALVAIAAAARATEFGAADVAAVQRALAERGYAVGVADGVMGPRTAQAIRAFEADKGWPATGALSERLVQALSSPRALAPIVLRPPPAVAAQQEAARLRAAVVNRHWLIRDWGADEVTDGAADGAVFGLYFEDGGAIAGPRFAERMRWQAKGAELVIRYESAVGATIERTGRLLDTDRLAGEAKGPNGAVWRWIAEARPRG